MPDKRNIPSASEIRSKIFTKKNFIEVAKIFGIYLTFLGSLWIMAQMYLDGYVDDKINQYDQKKIEEQKSKKPLRDILGETMHIHPDIVPFFMAKKFAELDSLINDINQFSDKLLPHLEKETIWVTPRLMIDPETGDHWWTHKDGKEYRVTYNHDGYGFIYINDQWTPIYK